MTFVEALKAFVSHCEQLRQSAHSVSDQPRCPGETWRLRVHDGKSPKYIKLVELDEDGDDWSVFCFIARETGDVLKAATWDRPHPKPRGSIFTPDDYGVEWHGAKYLR